MSGRCKSCNCVLTEYEMKLKDFDGMYTELCHFCYDELNILENSIEDTTKGNDFFREGRRIPAGHHD